MNSRLEAVSASDGGGPERNMPSVELRSRVQKGFAASS